MDDFIGCSPVSLEEMLDAREKRAARQRELIGCYRTTLICFTMNIPGRYKRFPLQEKAFDEGCSQICRSLDADKTPVFFKMEVRENTGCEGFYAVKSDPADVKKVMLEIEERHPLGRLFDIDVFGADGSRLCGTDFGRGERGCIVCGGPVWKCGRSRAHGAEELASSAVKIMRGYFDEKFAEKIARLAQLALLYETAATPKPGLVDRANNGAHSDMDFFTFISSACVLTPYFKTCTLEGLRPSKGSEALMTELRFDGLMAEYEMFRATNGVNTHKGAIFSLGLLAVTAGYLHGRGEELSPDNMSSACSEIAGRAVTYAELSGSPDTHGMEAYRKHRLTGARGEAAAGFPSAVRYGLPAMKAALDKGNSQNDACVIALLHLLAHVDDTNVLHRSGLEALRELQKRVNDKLSAAADAAELLRFAKELDAELIERNISPGGCADLLAVSLMLLFCSK